MLHDFDESTLLKQRFDEVGAPVLMSGHIGETIEFFYLDTEPSLKLILESGSGHAIDLVPDYTYPWYTTTCARGERPPRPRDRARPARSCPD